MPESNLLWLFNEEGAARHFDRLDGFLADGFERLTTPNGDGALVWLVYIGHGAFFGASRTYCLLLRDTRRPSLEDTSLRLPTLASVLRETAPESQRLVVLDSCFAGAGISAFQGSVDQTTAAEAEHAFEHERGVALLCAASARNPAKLDVTKGRTMFTGEFLDLLGEGDPSTIGPLSVRRVCELVRRRLKERHGDEAPRPEVHAPDQRWSDVAAVGLFPNVASTSANRESNALTLEPADTFVGNGGGKPAPDASPPWVETARQPDFHGGAVCFSPDGAYLATPLVNIIQLVDARNGGVRKLFAWPLDDTRGVWLCPPVFNRDGRCVAAAAKTTANTFGAWVWHRESGEALYAVPAPPGLETAEPALLFSPTGRYFAALHLQPTVWDTFWWREIADHDLGVGHPAAFGASDDWIAEATEDSVRLFELPTLDKVFESPHAGPAPVTTVDAHPTDAAIALSASDSRVCVHRRAEGPVLDIPLPEGATDVSGRFSPSGRHIIVRTGPEDQRHHYLYDAETGQPRRIPRFGAHRFAADDRRLVTFAQGMIEAWDLGEEKLIPEELVPKQLNTATSDGNVFDRELLGISCDGRYVATGQLTSPIRPTTTTSTPLVRLWDLDTGDTAVELDFAAFWCGLSPTELCFAAVGDKEIRLYRPSPD